MTRWLARPFRSRVARGIGANAYIQLVQIASQFTTVGVLTSHWGLRRYGFWLLVFTIPSYLNMTDFGLGSVATAKMTGLVAQNRRVEAVATYQAVRFTTFVTALITLVTVTIGAYVWGGSRLASYSPLAGGSVPLILIMLTLYGVLSLQNGVTSGGFAATGGYALSGYLTGTTFALETLCACTLVILGCSVFDVACSYLLVRALSTVAFSVALWHRTPWLATLRWQSSWAELRSLFRPAAAIIVLGVAQAATFQIPVSLIGLIKGPLAVPIFTVVRTVSRIAIQAILIVNHAFLPSFGAANALQNRERMRQFAILSIAVSLVCSSIGVAGMLLFGQLFIRIWTHGIVKPDFALIAVMGTITLVNTLWQPLSNLLLATNRQESYAYYYLIAAGGAMVISIPLIWQLGPTGAAIALLMADIVMFLRVARIVRDLDLVRWRELAGTAKNIGQIIRTRKAS